VNIYAAIRRLGFGVESFREPIVDQGAAMMASRRQLGDGAIT